MRVYGASRRDILATAAELLLGVEWKGRYGVALRPLTDRFRLNEEYLTTYQDGNEQRRRKVAVVCQHGYAAFIGMLLERHPGARIETVQTVYRGFDDYCERQPEIWVELLERYGEPDCTCAGAKTVSTSSETSP